MAKFEIINLQKDEAERALALIAAGGHAYNEDDAAILREKMENGQFSYVMAVVNGQDVGGFYMNWAPKYRVYQAMKLPELQDLRVLPDHRRHGLGAALLQHGEEMAREKAVEGLGLSVGLSADYGAAQRLYAKLGYVPDGHGITYDRVPVKTGFSCRLDDDLCLMLVKFF